MQRTAAGIVALLFAARALAQTIGPAPKPPAPSHAPMSRSELDGRASRPFPQPVRVESLLGRELLAPEESHPVLGRIVGLKRRGEGTIEVVVRVDGWLGLGWLGLRWVDWPGIGSRLVAVPAEAVALLGEYVALMDLASERLQTLSTFEPGTGLALGPDEMVRVGLVRPFH